MKIYRLREAKTSQLKKLLNNGNITEEQFQIADEFFKKYNSFEREIDWNRGLKITWDDLEKVIYKDRSSSKSQTKKKIRKGLEGFEEGKDYLVLKETSSYVVYQPFTWESSRMIASHYVEPSENEEGEVRDAEWCTAYQKNRDYWDAHDEIEAFIYICGEFIPSKKVAISISKEVEDASGSGFVYKVMYSDLNFNIWDFEDSKYTIEEEELLRVVPDLYDLIKEAYNNWENKNKEDFFSKLKLNPETSRYDYDGDLDLTNKKLKDFLAEDGNGFIINFGKVTGYFNCSYLGLKSLKGAPKEVGRNFYCYNNQLTSLEGAPQKVGGEFNCFSNQFTSLEGAPREVGGSFNCSWGQLTSLEGAPNYVGSDFLCYKNQLSSLKGAPQKIKGWFDCSENCLTSLEGAPKEVGGDFDCSNNQLNTLKGAPQKLGRNFHCRYNPNLHSLEGIGEVKGEIYKDF